MFERTDVMFLLLIFLLLLSNRRPRLFFACFFVLLLLLLMLILEEKNCVCTIFEISAEKSTKKSKIKSKLYLIFVCTVGLRAEWFHSDSKS